MRPSKLWAAAVDSIGRQDRLHPGCRGHHRPPWTRPAAVDTIGRRAWTWPAALRDVFLYNHRCTWWKTNGYQSWQIVWSLASWNIVCCLAFVGDMLQLNTIALSQSIWKRRWWNPSDFQWMPRAWLQQQGQHLQQLQMRSFLHPHQPNSFITRNHLLNFDICYCPFNGSTNPRLIQDESYNTSSNA